MKQPRPFLTASAVAAALFLAACASKLTEDNLQKIHNGMSPDEVKAILGNPTDVKTSSGPFGLMSGTTFTYHSNNSDVTITFLNDKVMATEGEFK
jgi:hypothetical protein